MAGINTLLRYISWGLVIIGPILLVSQLTRGQRSTDDAVVGTVAALVGMVPEGLVLLTSIAFLVGALTLARRKVLVQELPAVEGPPRRRRVPRQDGHADRRRHQLRRARDGRRPGPVGGRARARRWPTTPTQRHARRSAQRSLPRPAGSGRRPSRSRRPASGAEPPSTATAPVAQGPRAGSWAPEILFTGFTPDDSLPRG